MKDSASQAHPGELFVSDAFLSPLALSGCAAAQTGWQPLPHDTAPLFLKQHSYGEFVFDFQFAQAYRQHGLAYYPKLVCAVPFTPVTGPRLGSSPDGEALQALCVDVSASGAHVLFAPEAELQALSAAGWLWRQDLRFVWRDRGYSRFEDFLAALSSKKRKNIRAERRKVAALGLTIEWRPAASVPVAQWPDIFALYASTYAMRGQPPYLNQQCLQAWATNLPEAFQLCLASQGDELIAMALYFDDGQRLYGRHWGSRVDADGLHFELCYYQGIDYCIRHGRAHFDAGVQGGHRLLRGFEPELSHSAHWFADPRFQQAIGHFIAEERKLIQAQFVDLQSQTAFRQEFAE